MEFDPYINPLGADKVCGRCLRPVDVDLAHSKELVTEADHLRQAGEKEFSDLMMMLDNWGKGYLNIAKEGIDWSLPHELFEDFTDQMVPYIIRLGDCGYSTPERMVAIGDKVVEVMRVLIDFMQSEEDVLRLGGVWSDKDQEIKEYWEKKGESNAHLRIPVSTLRQLKG
jgi:hypothetical protein